MPIESRQIRLFASLFIGVIILLAGIWFFILKTEYVLIYQNIRQTDASQIVAELETAGIAYQLENDGHDILVPEGDAAAARVAVAGANIAMGGTTGFELFNENDLGLTEFAQKINFQRAIQGELARTIMMIDGVEFARVHLALPERSLFRSEQESPTAAVTVEMQASRKLVPASVLGIQQLVASSVPGLAIENVAVLDDEGSLMNAASGPGYSTEPEIQSERAAVENLLKVRATEAVAQVLPLQPVSVEVSAFERIGQAENAEEGDEKPKQDRGFGLDGRALRIVVRTPQELGPEERSIITNALVDAVQLSTEMGDVLDFSTGALVALPPTAATVPQAVPAAVPQASDGNWSASGADEWSFANVPWSWIVIPLLLVLLIVFAARPRRQISNTDAENFAELLRNAPIEKGAN